MLTSITSMEDVKFCLIMYEAPGSILTSKLKSRSICYLGYVLHLAYFNDNGILIFISEQRCRCIFRICAALAYFNDNGILIFISEQRCRCISYAMRNCQFNAGCCILNSISNKKRFFQKKKKILPQSNGPVISKRNKRPS